MKLKLTLAAFAAACALTSVPAAAQDYRDYRGDRDYRDHRGDRDYRRGDYRPAEITVRDRNGSITVDRGDRLYYRLKEGPFHFKDGRTYTYGRCRRDLCEVTVFDPYGRERRYDRISAPPLYARGYDRDRRNGYDRDRWD